MKRLLLLLSVLLLAQYANAFDFVKKVGGSNLFFSIEHMPPVDGKGTVSVSAYESEMMRIMGASSSVKGRLVIPSEVVYDGERYIVTSVEPHAFASCERLLAVTLPHTIVNVGDAAFDKCPNLKSVALECDSVQIALSAFAGCDMLDSLVIHDKVRYISQFAFSSVKSLKEIVLLSENVSSMQSLFYACESQAKLTVGPAVAVVPQFLCFCFYGLQEVEFAGDNPHTAVIDQYAFTNCTSLRMLHLPPSVGVIKSNAFSYCSFQLLEFNSDMPPILDETPFYGVDSSTNVTIPCGSRQNYLNSAIGKRFHNVAYPRGCPSDPMVQEVVYIHDTVWIHDTLYLPESMFRDKLETPTDEGSMYDHVETDTEQIVGDDDPQDWIFIEGRILRIEKAARLAGTAIRVYDERGDLLIDDRMPPSYRADNYYLKMPGRKRYFLIVGTLDAISVDVMHQRIGL